MTSARAACRVAARSANRRPESVRFISVFRLFMDPETISTPDANGHFGEIWLRSRNALSSDLYYRRENHALSVKITHSAGTRILSRQSRSHRRRKVKNADRSIQNVGEVKCL